MRRGRDLGGPAARAAYGGDLKPALVTTQGSTAWGIAFLARGDAGIFALP
jgi:hypothetical protein